MWKKRNWLTAPPLHFNLFVKNTTQGQDDGELIFLPEKGEEKHPNSSFHSKSNSLLVNIDLSVCHFNILLHLSISREFVFEGLTDSRRLIGWIKIAVQSQHKKVINNYRYWECKDKQRFFSVAIKRIERVFPDLRNYSKTLNSKELKMLAPRPETHRQQVKSRSLAFHFLSPVRVIFFKFTFTRWQSIVKNSVAKSSLRCTIFSNIFTALRMLVFLLNGSCYF